MLSNQIKTAFGDCKYQHKAVCNIPSSYEQVDNSNFWILDPIYEKERPCRVTVNNNDAQLQVVNNSNEVIDFIKLDNCLLNDDNKKCDCLLFNSKRLFFIEIKNSAAGNRTRKRREAVNQLGRTIEMFRQYGININNYVITAVICFKHSNSRPTQSSSNTKRALFQQQYNVSLEEGNVIEFA